MAGRSFLVWTASAFVLFFCFIASCLLAAFSISDAGRELFRDLRRKADGVAAAEDREKPFNVSYSVTFNDDGTANFQGRGFSLTLPKGYKVAAPTKLPEGKGRFEYYITSADGRVQLRLRREDLVTAGDNKVLFKHAEGYAKEVGGAAAVKAAPPAWVPASRLESSGADAGVEGCFAFTPARREAPGYEGEYFLFLSRGYANVVLVSVAFKQFRRETAFAAGRELAATLTFD